MIYREIEYPLSSLKTVLQNFSLNCYKLEIYELVPPTKIFEVCPQYGRTMLQIISNYKPTEENSYLGGTKFKDER